MVMVKKLCYTEWVFIGTLKILGKVDHEVIKKNNTSKYKEL